MQRLRTSLRKALAYFAYYSGLVWLYAAVKLRRRAVVLMYHRVLPGDANSFSSDGIIVTPSTFERHLRFLKRHFTLLDADEFADSMARGQFPHRACLITFDDGWCDNQSHALSALQRSGASAVLFVATGYVGGQRALWQEELTRLLFVSSRTALPVASVLDRLGLRSLRTASDADARRIARQFVTELKAADPAEVDRVREQVLDAIQGNGIQVPESGDDRFLDWESLRSLAATGCFSIASHAHSHRPLTRLGRSEATNDLKQSLTELKRHGLTTPLMCAYPNGDFDLEVTAAARDAGFRIAFTTISGHVSVIDDPLQLNRINIHESSCSSRAEFMCRILGLL